MADKNASQNSSLTGLGNKITSSLSSEWAKGPAVFDQSLYAGLGPTTTGALGDIVSGSNNQAFQQGNQGAIDFLGKTASGQYVNGVDPYFEANLSHTLNDAGTGVNAALGSNGRYGSNVHVDQLGSTLGGISNQARSANYQSSLDRQMQASQQLPSQYLASLLPAQQRLGVGQIQDADRQATLEGQNDLFRRKNDAVVDRAGQYFGILNGAAGSGATKEPTNPWLDALGIAGSLASIFL